MFSETQADILSYIPSDTVEIIGAPVNTQYFPTKTFRHNDKFTFGKVGYAGSKFYEGLGEVTKGIRDNNKVPNFKCLVIGAETGSHEKTWGSFSDPEFTSYIEENNLDSHFFIENDSQAKPIFSYPGQYYLQFDVYIAATSRKCSDSENKFWKSTDVNGNLAPPIETFCTTALEAMACGIPVIAEKKGGIKDWIRHNIDGFIAESPDEYIHYLEHLYSDIDLYWKMSKAAKDRARQFDIGIITDKYNKICLDLCP